MYPVTCCKETQSVLQLMFVISYNYISASVHRGPVDSHESCQAIQAACQLRIGEKTILHEADEAVVALLKKRQ